MTLVPPRWGVQNEQRSQSTVYTYSTPKRSIDSISKRQLQQFPQTMPLVAPLSRCHSPYLFTRCGDIGEGKFTDVIEQIRRVLPADTQTSTRLPNTRGYKLPAGVWALPDTATRYTHGGYTVGYPGVFLAGDSSK